ncbi:MAG: tRNA uridine-5-carboxymethylaminomethyl(34) synthesis GTPase MnmE [Verrucomicrobiota bacterium]
MVESQEETIVAVATPRGEGALAIVRLSGCHAMRIANECLGRGSPVDANCDRTLLLRDILDQDGERIDQVIVTTFVGPRSFTGEDTVELTCHGGEYVSARIVERLVEAGARVANAGEFSERAFTNGKIDLTQAEAIMQVVSARTVHSLRAANSQMNGGLRKRVQALRERILHILAQIEARIDFPEEDIEPETAATWEASITSISEDLQTLAAHRERSRMLIDGVSVAIVGPPNVGKSSLANRFLGFNRSIVSDIPGTTRDTVEEMIDLDGFPFRLIDTAGIRNPADDIEKEGVIRSRRTMEEADIVLITAAADQAPPEEFFQTCRKKDIWVVNKCDLELDARWHSFPSSWLPVSCKTGAGIGELLSLLRNKLFSSEPETRFLINMRQNDALQRCREHLNASVQMIQKGLDEELVAIAVREAIQAVESITGGALDEDLLNSIFGSFCLGK